MAALFSNNAFKITSAGAITEIIDSAAGLSGAQSVAVDGSGNVYVAGSSSNAFKITPAGAMTEIIDSTGDGTGNPLTTAVGVAVNGAGDVYVTGLSSHNAFEITPGGVITEIIDVIGDSTGGGDLLDGPLGIAVDAAGNVYVAGETTDNAFKITPGGVITEIIDGTGDGLGSILDGPKGIAVDASGNVYVTGFASHNVFKITPGGVITEIIDSSSGLFRPRGIAVDASGNVVTGSENDRVFKITPGGVITEIINFNGDGTGNRLDEPIGIAVDGAGNVYVSGLRSRNVFQITPGGAITEIIDSSSGVGLPWGIAVDALGNVSVADPASRNAFKITPGGVITAIIDSTGDGAGNPLTEPRALAADGAGNVYVAGFSSRNAFQITPGGVITEIIDTTGDGLGNPLQGPEGIAVDALGFAYVTGGISDNAFKICTNACFSKSFAPATIVAGTTSTLTFTIDNGLSATAASALDFTDPLPAGVVVAAPPNPSTTCGGVLSPSPGDTSISFSGGTVGANSTCTVEVDVTSATAGEYANTTGDLTSSQGNHGFASATLTVVPPPTVDFTAAAQSNAESVAAVTVTAQLSMVSGSDVEVPLLFSGSAADPADYSPDVTTLVIPAGTLSADLTLTVVDDALDEPSELVDVQMGPPTGAVLGTVTLHTAIIQDNDPPPTVDFTAGFQSNAESVTAVTVTAQLSAVSAFTVQVPLVFGGSAADPADYSPDVTTLTIPPGMLSADLTLTVVDDAIDELTEVMDVMMGVPVNAVAGTVTTHTALIQDNDDPPVVDFTAAAQSNDEGVSPVTVTAQLSGPSGLDVEVPLSFSGNAGDPDDYGVNAVTLPTITIPAGMTTGDVTLTVVDDAIDENDETVVITMGTPTNATLGTTTEHTATIEDNDATPTVDFTAASQSNDKTADTVTLTLQLAAASGLEVQVPLTFGGTTTDPDDYGPDLTTLTIAAGTTSADLTLTVVDDAIDENDETVVVTMGTPTHATPGTTTAHTATVEDNDATPMVDFTAAAQSNDESTTAVTVTAQLSAVSGLEVRVPVTFGGTAADPDDYGPDVTTLTIPAGMPSADLTLTVIDDAIDENDETVIVTMGTPTHADLGTTTVHTATIEDNDATPEVNFTSATQSNDESVADVTVTAQLSAVSGLEVQVPLNLGGTATDPDDYGPDTTTLTIDAGALSADLTLTVVDDAVDELDETVVVTLGALVNAVPGTSITVHTATIEDNAPKPTVTFTAAGQSNDESVSPLTVTAELSAASGLEVQVPLVFGGNAADPADYSPDVTTIVIAAGTTSADLTLTVVDDTLDETSELIDVMMGSPAGAVPGAVTLHTAVIGDNDPAPSVELSTALQSNDESVTPVTVTAVLSGPSGKQVQVPVSFDGTAGDPADYSPSDTVILIQAGQTSGDITLAVVDDLLDEPTELVDVTMGTPVNAVLGATTVQTVLIEDNDVPNAPPQIAILQPDGLDDTADGDFLIVWSDADPDDNATIDLYYDSDASGEDGTFITSFSENPDGAGDDRHLWDTSLLANGDYFVYAVIDDGVSPPVVDYSVGPVTVDHSAVACAPPAAGDWMVTASCTVAASDTAPGDVIVAPGVVLTVDNHVTLEIDLVNHQLLVQAGGGVLVRPLGVIRQP
ncbi:MAG: hypothetical protein GY713_15715 [Actinomycetia bacterium]|nr:hypothetical protein [Actinomycetes bacterium]